MVMVSGQGQPTENSNPDNNNKTQHTMKKLVLTIAVVLSFVMSVSAQDEYKGGGLFKRGAMPTETATRQTPLLALPTQHGQSGDQPTDSVPVGSGMAVLVGLGAAYLVAQRRKEK